MLKVRIRGFCYALSLAAICILPGCSSTRLSVIPPSNLAFHNHAALCGTLKYEMSNKHYLPEIINQDFQTSQSYPQLEYAYEVSYDVDYDTAFELFNPFLILGIPKSQDDVFISGQLRITGVNDFSKLYQHSVSVSKKESVFSDGDTLSELRRKGLAVLRDSIDEMVLADMPLLESQGITCKSKTKT